MKPDDLWPDCLDSAEHSWEEVGFPGQFEVAVKDLLVGRQAEF